MNILALDLGTKTGWALNGADGVVTGTETLGTREDIRAAHVSRLDRRCDPRIPKLHQFLLTQIQNYKINLLVFEDVLFASTRMQAHLWASLRAAAWIAGSITGCQIDCLNTVALKKYASGHASATKETMAAALKKIAPGLDFSMLDDNMIDAIWLWRWAGEQYGI